MIINSFISKSVSYTVIVNSQIIASKGITLHTYVINTAKEIFMIKIKSVSIV
jgi:hypothetical protein